MQGKRHLGLVTLVAGLVVATAAGCGGGSDKKANQAYATGVCTAIGNWANEVRSLATIPSGGVSTASLQKKLTQFETATKTLVAEIKSVPAPNTSDGQAAKKQIDQLAGQVESTTAAVKSAAATLPANPTVTEVASALSALAPQFKTLQTAARSTVSALQTAKGSLASAFRSERVCKNLGS
jgi:hypothetical protein